MTGADTDLAILQNRHPEWAPWLTVVQLVLGEIAGRKWDSFVPKRANIGQSKTPLLARAELRLPRRLLQSLASQLLRTAARSNAPAMATLAALAEAELDLFSLFKATLQQDREAVRNFGMPFGVEPGAFESVTALIPVPLLQACNRAWENIVAPGWIEGYCPICGAWPAYAEVRGIERSRHLRCGRCGSGWQAHGLSCAYCGMTDHNELLSLVPENNSSNGVIDACKRCLGYLKIFTKLQGSAPAKVIVDDLASVELDVAAADQGYKRPPGSGYYLDVNVAENGAAPTS